MSDGTGTRRHDTLLVIDRSGMAVATTTTLEGSFGLARRRQGRRVPVEQRDGDFKKARLHEYGRRHRTPANVIAPGKRMLSSMTPTIVVPRRQGRARHRIARRTNDRQHRAVGRPRRHGIRSDGAQKPSPRACTINGCRIASPLKPTGYRRDAGATPRDGSTRSRRRPAEVEPTRSGLAPTAPYGVHDKRAPDSKASVPRNLTSPSAGR